MWCRYGMRSPLDDRAQGLDHGAVGLPVEAVGQASAPARFGGVAGGQQAGFLEGAQVQGEGCAGGVQGRGEVVAPRPGERAISTRMRMRSVELNATTAVSRGDAGALMQKCLPYRGT